MINIKEISLTIVKEKLKVGQIVENYKKLCIILDVEVKSGQAKINQLKDFERYFKYKRKGNKYIITEILNKEISKISGNDLLVLTQLSIYEELKQHNQKKSNNPYETSITKLAKKIGYTNQTFSKYYSKPGEISSIINNKRNSQINRVLTEEFYQKVISMYRRNIKNALDLMENDKIIRVKKIYRIVDLIVYNPNINYSSKTDEYGDSYDIYNVDSEIWEKARIATPEDIEKIEEIHNSILLELDCENMHDVFAKRCDGKYYKIRKEKLAINNIKDFYITYEIELIGSYILQDEKTLKYYSIEINKIFKNKIIINKKRNNEKKIKDIEFFDIDIDKELEDFKLLVFELINIEEGIIFEGKILEKNNEDISIVFLNLKTSSLT